MNDCDLRRWISGQMDIEQTSQRWLAESSQRAYLFDDFEMNTQRDQCPDMFLFFNWLCFLWFKGILLKGILLHARFSGRTSTIGNWWFVSMSNKPFFSYPWIIHFHQDLSLLQETPTSSGIWNLRIHPIKINSNQSNQIIFPYIIYTYIF